MNDQPAVTIYLPWRRPKQVMWQTVGGRRTLIFLPGEGQACFPMGRLDAWRKFAVQNASEKVIERLCQKYGYLLMPRGTSNKCQTYNYWFVELKLLWIVAQLCDLLKKDDTNLNEGVRTILKFKEIYGIKQLGPFLRLLYNSSLTPVREEQKQIYDYADEDHTQQIKTEQEWQSWVSQDWVVNADRNTGEEKDHEYFVTAAGTHDYEALKQQSEQNLQPTGRTERFKKRKDLEDAYQYFDWTKADVQKGVQDIISSYTRDVRVTVDLTSKQLRLQPPTLLAGLWLQLAQWSLTGHAEPLSLCLHCGRIMDKRDGTKYCSSACRTAAFRETQRVLNGTKVSLPRHNQARKVPNSNSSTQTTEA